MKHDDSKELLPVVDEAGNVTGSATRGECHGGAMLLHPVVHLHVVDSAGRIYLQRRPMWKDVQPGRWDTAVGGHVDYGEEVATALVREVREEVGLEDFRPQHVTSYVFRSPVEREFVNVFVAVGDYSPRPTAELDGGRFWPREEIERAMGRGILTPNFEHEYRTVIRPWLDAGAGKESV